MNSGRQVSVEVEPRVEFVPARIPTLVTASPPPSKAVHVLQADM